MESKLLRRKLALEKEISGIQKNKVAQIFYDVRELSIINQTPHFMLNSQDLQYLGICEYSN